MPISGRWLARIPRISAVQRRQQLRGHGAQPISSASLRHSSLGNMLPDVIIDHHPRPINQLMDQCSDREVRRRLEKGIASAARAPRSPPARYMDLHASPRHTRAARRAPPETARHAPPTGSGANPSSSKTKSFSKIIVGEPIRFGSGWPRSSTERSRRGECALACRSIGGRFAAGVRSWQPHDRRITRWVGIGIVVDASYFPSRYSSSTRSTW